MRKGWIETIYRDYHNKLFLYAFSLTKSKADAEDLVQETFIKALSSFNKKKYKIEPWLFLVLKHLFIDHYRKNKKLLDEGQYAMDWLEDPYDATEAYIKNEKRRWLYAKIYDLPQRERDVMLLTLTTTLSDDEIAKQLNISAANIRVIRHRIKSNLTILAQKEGFL